MLLTNPELTSASRPSLLDGEELLFVQDGVAIYDGNFKVTTCQKGHAYLTSHRACYIDDTDPRSNSLAVDLKDVERHEYQASFLRSSPKVTLFPKPVKRGFGSLRQHTGPSSSSFADRGYSASSPVSRVPSPFKHAPARAASPRIDRGVWICAICSFSNPVPSNFDPTIANEAFPLPPCLTCGIKPEFAHVLKAAIVANSERPQARKRLTSMAATAIFNSTGVSQSGPASGSIACPRCTFSNHASMRVCEVCGAALPLQETTAELSPVIPQRATSPGPEIARLDLNDDIESVSIKFSFRAGGDKIFYEKLKNAMIQRRWLLQHAPPIPKPDLRFSNSADSVGSAPVSRPQSTSVGIAGLEQRGLQSRRNNEVVLGSAFEDLEALMSSAKDIVALAEKFAAESGTGSNALLSESAAALGMLATKDMMNTNSNMLYISELSRNLAEYVTDERRGILRANGGIIGLVDLWAVINRARNGVELISPADFHNAAEAWDRLRLPIRLRQFKSGLLVVQPRDWTDEKTINQLIGWLRSLQASPPEGIIPWDWTVYGCGVTAQEAASRFGWSLGVANEELEMAEEKGVLCREEGIEGLKFWLNYLVDIEAEE